MRKEVSEEMKRKPPVQSTSLSLSVRVRCFEESLRKKKHMPMAMPHMGRLR